MPTSGTATLVDSDTAPASCGEAPPTTPAAGSFQVVCDTAGTNNAVVSVGTLTTGTEAGDFSLRVNQTPQPVHSNQVVDDIPVGAALALVFTPTGGAARTLQSATAPGTCTTPTTRPRRRSAVSAS